MRITPTLLIAYSFLMLTHGIFATGLDIEVSAESVALEVDLPQDGYVHCRIDCSEDLTSWGRLSALKLLDGQGSADIVLAEGEGLPDRMFFQVIEDDTAANVLELPDTADDYETVVWPAHLSTEVVIATDNTPVDNPVTDEGALLGRVLFYDNKLSLNYSISCASCHQQAHGFSDPDALSIGFEGRHTGRNSMGLTNAQFYGRENFFWDERAATLEDQVLGPVQDSVEMGMTLPALVERVESYEYYEDLFINAFGDATVSSDRIALALAQFVRSIVSTESKYDLGVANGFVDFTAEETIGMDLFFGRGKCNACHVEPNFVGNRIDNNGLEFPYVDAGVGAVTGRDQDQGKFKMSSLRNIEKTAPYMHDGRFATLEEVIDHYDSGVVDNPNLGGQLRNQEGEIRVLGLTQAQKDGLVAFLLTLTDESVQTDPKWSDPFAAGAQ